MNLEEEIRRTLNCHSAENASNTPDFILAQFVLGCLAAYNQAVQQRETWYKRDARPGENPHLEAREKKGGTDG